MPTKVKSIFIKRKGSYSNGKEERIDGQKLVFFFLGNCFEFDYDHAILAFITVLFLCVKPFINVNRFYFVWIKNVQRIARNFFAIEYKQRFVEIECDNRLKQILVIPDNH